MSATEPKIVCFSVYLRFGAWSHSKPRCYDEFLDYLPYFLQTICEKEIRFDIDRVRRGAARTDIHLDLNVVAPSEGDIRDAECRRYGVANPVTARATAALSIWLGSLRDPFRAAWLMWCAQEGLDPAIHQLPVYLHAYGFRERVSAPAPWQKLTPDQSPLTGSYDGSTQTST